jgi:alkylhydroperoxidase family enzyme
MAMQVQGRFLSARYFRNNLAETEQRLYTVAVWREAPFFNERERAALAWTETVTLIAQTGVPDDVYQIARNQFSEKRID